MSAPSLKWVRLELGVDKAEEHVRYLINGRRVEAEDFRVALVALEESVFILRLSEELTRAAEAAP